jgi:hypothetical protein
MQIRSLFFLVTAFLISACGVNSQEFVCASPDAPLKYTNSLKINKDSAAFNMTDYKKLCKKMGNFLFFGENADSCGDSKKVKFMVFDEVVYGLRVVHRDEANISLESGTYSCKKTK